MYALPAATGKTTIRSGNTKAMNAISNSSVNNQIISQPQGASASAAAGRNNEEVPAAAGDTVELSSGGRAAEGTNTPVPPKKGLRGLIRRGMDVYKEASDSPITFVKDHHTPENTSKLVGFGTLALCTAIVVADSADDDKIDDVKDIAEDALKGGGVKNKMALYSDVANFVGVESSIGCAVGGGAFATMGLVQAGQGIVKTVKGIKAHSLDKTARGLRTTVAGTRKALTGGVVATLNVDGKVGAASKFVKKFVMPPLRKLAAGLNIGIGAKTLADGIKKKDKAKIITGALDLGYGSAVVVSIAVGGPIAAGAAAGILTAKEGWGWTKKIGKYIKKDKEIQAKRAEEARNRQQTNGPAPEASSVQRSEEASPAPAPQKHPHLRKIADTAINVLLDVTSNKPSIRTSSPAQA